MSVVVVLGKHNSYPDPPESRHESRPRSPWWHGPVAALVALLYGPACVAALVLVMYGLGSL